MSRLRIILIASFVILGVLLVFTLFRPVASETTQLTRESTILTGDEWITQFDIMNHEGRDITYIINWSSGESRLTQIVSVLDGEVHRHVYHAYPETVTDGKVHLTIYKEGEATPFEDTTYYISFD